MRYLLQAVFVVMILLVASGCTRTRPEAVESGFTPLFNGVDLAGWIGDTDGYAVEDGVLICKQGSGGNLYTERQYADFDFRFEFKLDPGSNNGVGIRAEPGKDAAYYGMEIQIIDDYAEKWADLQPYQYHGSIYGVVPAERGALKPAGEWNSEQIIARGDHIIVRLNGETIVDANLREAAANGTIDGNEHPGLFNEQGHIGFLGHGDRIELRNIRIQEL